ncbi:diguanylate cyclase domain-containing protein [Duganella violaceipulchra]|uniref:Diguanylate cyclase n=1 Tax=Duganella violaceipulchra TaxID=2849652 RepID=A0AA41HCV9_9BURK|nr:diguanylate cyclase [Duganella violaceicalia]MBV6324989.1 diguanylate cyclase [Duganella violaceicalia]MCP2009168.1 diguanylate cyclase (GGDEF)-like protein/PAS domain S-box-containing protein [Duganella violaceicalia]
MNYFATRPFVMYLRHLYRAILLPVFALALLAALWAAAAYQIGQEKLTAHYEAVLHSQSLARTLAEHTNHLLRQIDHATQLFKLKYEETGGTLRLAEFTRRNGLLDSLLPSKLDLPLALVGADGRLLDSRNGYFAPDQHQQAFFSQLANNTADTPLVTTPVVEPRTKKWQIQISRRLNNRQGEFAGIIMVMIDPAAFVEDYDRLNVDPGGAVLLISRENGMSTARVDEQVIISDSIDFTVAQGGRQQSDELLLAHPFDAVERIYGYTEMPRYLMLAVVGNPVTSAMATFEHRRDIYYRAVAVASVLVLLFVGLLMQQAHRLRRSARMVTEAQTMLRAAADASMDAVYLLKACHMRGPGKEVVDFTIADLNERGAALLGSTTDEIKGRRLIEVLPALHTKGFLEKYKTVLASGRPLEEEFEIDFLPGRGHLWLHHQIVAIHDGVAVTTRDITPRKESELAMRKNQAELAAVNDASPLGLIRADPAGHCTYVNRTFEFITGLTRDEALGDAWLRAVHPNDRQVLKEALKHMAKTRVPYQDTVRCVHPDGMMVWVSFKVAAMVVDGHIYGYVGTVDDITHVRKSVMALRESEARLRTIADTLPAMVAYVDSEEIYRFHNVAYEREFNRSGLTVLGKSIEATMGQERYQFLSPYIKRALAGETLTFEEEDPDSTVGRTFEVVYIPQMDEDGVTVIGFHVMRQDITAQKREKQRLLKLSQVDALTGLTNRAGFLQKLQDTMAACRENHSLMAVMYMDIDRFKPVNDTFGHSVGDALLRAFSGRLTHAMRATDTIARLGGDEFTIIMERIGRMDAADALAAKIVTAMQAPFDLDGTVVSISASIGMAYYRGEDVTPAELLNRADVLLYEAKQGGRNTYRAGPALPTTTSNAA